ADHQQSVCHDSSDVYCCWCHCPDSPPPIPSGFCYAPQTLEFKLNNSKQKPTNMSGARADFSRLANTGGALFSSRRSTYERRAVLPSARMIHDVRPVPSKQVKSKSVRGPVFAMT